MGGSSSRSIRPLVQGQCKSGDQCTDVVNDGTPGDPGSFNRNRDTSGLGPQYPGNPLPRAAFQCRSHVQPDGSTRSSCHIRDPCYSQVCDVQGDEGHPQVFTPRKWQDLVRWNIYQNRSDTDTCGDVNGSGGTPREWDGTRHKGCLGTSYSDGDAQIADHDVSGQRCTGGKCGDGSPCTHDEHCRINECQRLCLADPNCVAASMTRKDFNSYQNGQRDTMKATIATATASAWTNVFAPGITAAVLAAGYEAARGVGDVDYIPNTQCKLFNSFDEGHLRHCGCDDGGVAGAQGKGCGGLIPGDLDLQCGALTMRPIQFVCDSRQGVQGYRCERTDGSVAHRGDLPDGSFSMNKCDKLRYFNDPARDKRLEEKCCDLACTGDNMRCVAADSPVASDRMRRSSECHVGRNGDFYEVQILGDSRGPLTSGEVTLGMNMTGRRGSDGELDPANQIDQKWKMSPDDAYTTCRNNERCKGFSSNPGDWTFFYDEINYQSSFFQRRGKYGPGWTHFARCDEPARDGLRFVEECSADHHETREVRILGDSRGPITSRTATLGFNHDGRRGYYDNLLTPTNELVGQQQWQISEQQALRKAKTLDKCVAFSHNADDWTFFYSAVERNAYFYQKRGAYGHGWRHFLLCDHDEK